jgi:hypothetical protein
MAKWEPVKTRLRGEVSYGAPKVEKSPQTPAAQRRLAHASEAVVTGMGA